MDSWHGPRDRRGRLVVTAVCAALAAGALALAVWKTFHGDDLTAFANLATVAGSIGSAFLTILSVRSPPVAADALETVRDNLAHDLLGEYRQLRKTLLGWDYKAIDVRFRHTPAPGRNAAGAERRGSFDQVADYYRGLSPSRMAVTGPPGAGKTLLSIELAVELLEAREPGGRVPFLASAALWDTSLTLREWLEQQLSRISGNAGVLVRSGSILPILDGLDEMVREGTAPQRLAVALERLNDDERGEPLVVTCRTDEYRELRALGHRLEDCASVELDSVPAGLAREYLEDRASDPGLWQPVLEDLEQCPSGILVTTLSSPWLLTMVSTVARAEGGTAFLGPFLGRSATSETVAVCERELLSRYVAATTALQRRAGNRTYDEASADRWVSQLATFLRVSGGRVLGGRLMSGREIVLHELWPLAGDRAPRAVTAALAVALWIPVFAALTACLAQRGFFPTPGVWILLLLALLPAMSAVSSLGYWPQPRRILPSRLITTRGLARVGCGAALGAVLGANVGLVFGVGFGLSYGAGYALVFGIGLAVSVRSDIHMRATLATALAVGLAAGAAAGATLRNFGAFAGLVVGLAAGALALTAAVHVGITMARGRGGGAPDQNEPGLPGPESALRDDIAVGAAAGTVTGILAVIVSWRAPWLSVPLPLAAALGTSAVLAAGPGFTSSISRRYLALLLCTRGRLPWRLAHFLRWARTAGMLRVAGTAYQFRHDRLLQWLGSGPGAGQAAARTADRATRTRQEGTDQADHSP